MCPYGAQNILAELPIVRQTLFLTGPNIWYNKWVGAERGAAKAAVLASNITTLYLDNFTNSSNEEPSKINMLNDQDMT